MSPSGPALIAGGGIGGLAAALTLARAGFEVELHERAPRFSEVGAGLQISPNAARLLQAIGLDAALDPVLGRPEALVVRAGPTGKVLVEMALGDVAERRWGAPSWVIHRADLLGALVEAARAEPRIRLHQGASVDDVREDADGVTIALEDGREARGALLVGADGIWSKVRQRVVGDETPRYTGRWAFRATVPVDRVPAHLRRNATGLWLGPGAHLVHYALRGGAIVNIVAIVAAETGEEGWEAFAERSEVIERFAEWTPLARELIAAPERWTRWALFDRRPDKTWPAGRVALLGDAAHPMVPFLAQGASMAIEDAAVLARCLQHAPSDVPKALARYRTERLPRVTRVQAEATKNGEVFHLAAPLSYARDATLSLLGGQGLAARYDWLYGARV